MKVACPNCYSSDTQEKHTTIPYQLCDMVDGWTTYKCNSCNHFFVDCLFRNGTKRMILLHRDILEPRCAICKTTKDIKLWVNPSNPSSKDYYCEKHSPCKAFEKLQEIIQLTKVKV